MSVKDIARSGYRLFRKVALQSLIPASRAPFILDKNHAIEVIGFFETFSGIGESARLCATALQKAGYNVVCTTVEPIFRKPSDTKWNFTNAPSDKKISVRIFHLNPPMMPPAIFALGLKNFAATYNIGYWAWELEVIPQEWVKTTKYINAVFTPSDFTTKVIQKFTDKPVLTVLHPVSIDQSSSLVDMRERLGIAQNTLMFSSVFSFGSAMERKNPQAVIRAFQKAFTPDDDVVLVLKSNSATSEQKSDIAKLVGAYKNIRLYDEFWSTGETRGLIASSDLYISLHRSEGFGLTIAEAMLLNTAVMVTNWSGNTGFCDADNAFLIGYNQVPVVSAHPEFKNLKNVTWADADTDQAARILSQIKSDPSVLKRMADTASASLQQKLGTEDYSSALGKLVAGVGFEPTTFRL